MKRRLYAKDSESSLSVRESPEAFAARLAAFEKISFDVFDTLLLRLVSSPKEVFYLVGMELGCPDFCRLRIEAERRARREAILKRGGQEVSLEEIWEKLELETGILAHKGAETEFSWELRCCQANPYMLEVFRELKRLGKEPAAVSDMYLGEERVRRLLRENGYGAIGLCLVSCDYGVSKADGGLYVWLKKKQGGKTGSWAHVGDSLRADVLQARRRGAYAFYYRNVNRAGERYRTRDMSLTAGSLYRGLVNGHIHCGLKAFTREYEYGFIYGGLFALGYCRFIHDTARRQGAERLLFFSRDGWLLLKLYRRLYPEERARTAYARWSRLAALKITADGFRAEYFKRFLFHGAGEGCTLRQALDAMALPGLAEELLGAAGLKEGEALTHKKAEIIKDYLIKRWPRVLELYRREREAAGRYYGRLLEGCRRAAAVDVGWAGSGAVMLDYAVNRLWGMSCPIIGLLGGAVGCRSQDRDAWEMYRQEGRVFSYLFSQQENRDLWKNHLPGRGDNLFWELLLGAAQGSLTEIIPGERTGYQLLERSFLGKPEKIHQIHRGILDFAELYLSAEKRLGMEIPISGRDAGAPMALVCSRENKRFRKGLLGLLDQAGLYRK